MMLGVNPILFMDLTRKIIYSTLGYLFYNKNLIYMKENTHSPIEMLFVLRMLCSTLHSH